MPKRDADAISQRDISQRDISRLSRWHPLGWFDDQRVLDGFSRAVWGAVLAAHPKAAPTAKKQEVA